MLVPVMVDTKLHDGSMSSRFFFCEQSTRIICAGHTPTGLVCTLPVRDLGDSIIPRFLSVPFFIFIVIHRNTISGGWGLAPIYNFLNSISYFLDNFLQLSNMADLVPVM